MQENFSLSHFKEAYKKEHPTVKPRQFFNIKQRTFVARSASEPQFYSLERRKYFNEFQWICSIGREKFS